MKNKVKVSLKAIGLFLSLISVGHCGKLTSVQWDGFESYFSGIKNDRLQYRDAFCEEKEQELSVQEFRLRTGLEIKAEAHVIDSLKLEYKYGLPTELENVELTSDYQDFQFGEKIKHTISLRRKYGRICNDSMQAKDWDSFKMALLYPEKIAQIDDYQFKITNITILNPVPNFILKSVSKQDHALVIRPDLEGTEDFAAFFADPYKETLVATFKIENILRNFEMHSQRLEYRDKFYQYSHL